MADFNARIAKAPLNPKDMHGQLAEHECLEQTFIWQENRAVTNSLTVQYDRVDYFLEPNDITLDLRRKKIRIFDYPDGIIEIRFDGFPLPYTIFDKVRQVKPAEVVSNKRFGAVLQFIQEEQATQQPPAKAGGFVLWTESPDTGQKTRLSFSPEVVVYPGLEMMLQVLFNHLFRQFARGHTKIPSCPEMPTPVTLPQIRKALKQLRRTAPLDTTHDLAWRQIRRRRNQQVHVVFTHNTFENIDLEGLTRLTYQFSRLQTHVTLQYVITIFRNKYKVILYLVNCMTAVTIFHPYNLASCTRPVSQINLTA